MDARVYNMLYGKWKRWTLPQLMIGRGNHRVKKMYLYPYPSKPLPVRRVKGTGNVNPPKVRVNKNLYPYTYHQSYSNLWQFLKPAMSKNVKGSNLILLANFKNVLPLKNKGICVPSSRVRVQVLFCVVATCSVWATTLQRSFPSLIYA